KEWQAPPRRTRSRPRQWSCSCEPLPDTPSVHAPRRQVRIQAGAWRILYGRPVTDRVIGVFDAGQAFRSNDPGLACAAISFAHRIGELLVRALAIAGALGNQGRECHPVRAVVLPDRIGWISGQVVRASALDHTKRAHPLQVSNDLWLNTLHLCRIE